MIKEEKDFWALFKGLIISITQMLSEKAKSLKREVSELDRQCEEHKKYVAEQKEAAIRNAQHAINIRMLQQILSEAHNAIPDNIRVSSMLSDKSMKVEFNENTLCGSSYVYLGKRLDNYTLTKYQEGFEEALRAITTDAFYDFAAYIEQLGVKYHNACLENVIGKGNPMELNPMMYWSDYSNYYSHNKHRIYDLEILRMKATPTGVNIEFKVKPQGIYAVRWWAIDTNRFPAILEYAANGGDMVAYYLGI